MNKKLVTRIEQCIEDRRAGTLTEQQLLDVLAIVKNMPEQRQDLLYLQTNNTSVASQIVGMALVQNGEVVVDLPDADQWPYATVLDAIRDGWRIISFPNQALMMDESRVYGLGCEFVLEKWSCL
jgi:hypothetical protein